MSKLVEIVKGDFEKVHKEVYELYEVVEPVTTGIARGLYSPFALCTGIRKFLKEFDDDTSGSFKPAVKGAFQMTVALFAHMSLGFAAADVGYGEEYLAALAIGNVIDYGASLYRRSKE